MHRVLGINEADNKELARWILSLPKPCGVMVLNDGRARQLAEACLSVGVRIPDQVAIVGVDDDDIICELAAPRLSSIVVPIEQIGYEATSMLATLMAGKKPARKQVLVPPIAVATRNSSSAFAVEDEYLAKALRLIRENGRDPFYGIDQLLRELPVSRRSLETRFRKLLGRSPHQELERLRLTLAQQLLAETDLSIPQVSKWSGYNSLEHFSYMFRKKIGVPPTTYRRRYRVEGAGSMEV